MPLLTCRLPCLGSTYLLKMGKSPVFSLAISWGFVITIERMKKITSDAEWAAIYPLFGFLLGRVFIGGHTRRQAIFDSDVEAMYVFYRLGELNAAAHHQPGNIERLIEGTISNEEYSRIKLTPVTALSLAEIMRRPRETVRRKLKKLVELGLAQDTEIDGRRGYIITRAAIERFYHENRTVYNDLVYMVETLRRYQDARQSRETADRANAQKD